MQTLDEIAMRAEAWARGWTLTRQTSPPRQEEFGWRIEVDRPGQRRRFILPGLGGLEQLGAALHAPETWLKICAPREPVAALLGGRWQLQPQEYLMHLRWRPEPAAVPAGYVLHEQQQGPVLLLELRTTGGEPAAQARCGIAQHHAVVDQVVTEAAHRRRGLGALLMKTLGNRALRAGAGQGVLVATEDGRALYASLGWTLVSPMTAALAMDAPAD